jgi:hypothetical protein
MTAKNSRIYLLEPAGLLDRGETRISQHKGVEVQKVQPHGCPKNGTMGMVYVQVADTGQFIGLVSKHSLVATTKMRPLRDLAAEAMDHRRVQGRIA